jgi:surface protein
MPPKKKTKKTFANFYNPDTYVKETTDENDLVVHIPFGLPTSKRARSKQVVPTINTRLELVQTITEYLGDDRLSFNYVDIGSWDISKVTSLHELFCYSRKIDTREKNDLLAGISNWNVEHVTSMSKMFKGCTHFNQPLNWNVRNVGSMEEMFEDCREFNSALNWEGVNPNNLSAMFKNCTNFNQQLINWDLSRVANLAEMFMSCNNFNSPLQWQGVNPHRIVRMFNGCHVFNQPLIDWNVSRVENMDDLFRDCRNFNQPLISWDMTNVGRMNRMFMGCVSLNSGLDFRNLRPDQLSEMFHGCGSFNQPLIGWDVSQVEIMESMFQDCSRFNQPLIGWNVSNVTNMKNMFMNCTVFDQDLTEWTVDPACDVEGMFNGCDSLTYFPYWYVTQLETNFPKSRVVVGAPPPIPGASSLFPGLFLPGGGVPLTPPAGVPPFDRSTITTLDWYPIEVRCKRFVSTLSNREKALLEQYMKTDCYLEEVDCYVGNRLTTYLLRRHPKIIARYPEYINPLEVESFSPTFPVSFDTRYMTQQKLLSILQGFRDLNVLLKRFPPLNSISYPNGVYLYRAQRYEGEIERLAIGQEFLLTKVTSTSLSIDVSAKLFATGIQTYYSGNLETLGFIWRIKFPLGLPCAYIGNKNEEEVALPLGTKVRYLGAWVQENGLNTVYDSPEYLNTYTTFQGFVEGALICEFEVVEMVEGPLLQVLVDVVNEDFARGNTAIYARDLTLPASMGPNPNRHLRTRPIGPDEAFGKWNTHKRKPRRTGRRRKGFAHTAKRNKRRRDTRKK